MERSLALALAAYAVLGSLSAAALRLTGPNPDAPPNFGHAYSQKMVIAAHLSKIAREIPVLLNGRRRHPEVITMPEFDAILRLKKRICGKISYLDAGGEFLFDSRPKAGYGNMHGPWLTEAWPQSDAVERAYLDKVPVLRPKSWGVFELAIPLLKGKRVEGVLQFDTCFWNRSFLWNRTFRL